MTTMWPQDRVQLSASQTDSALYLELDGLLGDDQTVLVFDFFTQIKQTNNMTHVS